MNAIKPSTPARPLQASEAPRPRSRAVNFHAREIIEAAGRICSFFETNPGRILSALEIAAKLDLDLVATHEALVALSGAGKVRAIEDRLPRHRTWRYAWVGGER